MRIVRVFSGLFVALTVASGAWWLWQDFQTYLNQPIRFAPSPTRFVVERGQSFAGMVRALERAISLRKSYYLRFHARNTGQASAIKAGEYDLDSELSPRALLAQLVAGKVVQHPFTIVEGVTFAELMTAVAQSEVLVQTLSDRTANAVMTRLGHAGLNPEGRFFPDTYHYPRGTTDTDFLRRAFVAMERHLAKAWTQRDPDSPLDSPAEALVLASIIEKETGLGSERERIAGVFVRRLRKGMRLETDPTVIYGLGESFDGNLRRADLRRDTPYNTYTRKGLPPTPIAIPSAGAVYAALHPAPGNELFFVAKGDGSHHFSATYAEHRRAVVRYQLRRSKRKTRKGT